MKFNIALRNLLIVLFGALVLSACSTTKKGDLSGDVYTGTETIEYLAKWCSGQSFFATNKSSLTTAARDTLRKQATWLRKNKDITVTVEGHADERGTREYNLALGERRANAAKDYLMTYGISGKRISVISYGKEKPVNPASESFSLVSKQKISYSKSKLILRILKTPLLLKSNGVFFLPFFL